MKAKEQPGLPGVRSGCECCTRAHSTHSSRSGAPAPDGGSTRLTLPIGLWSSCRFFFFLRPRQQLRHLGAKNIMLMGLLL